MNIVVTFQSTHHAMKAKKIVQASELSGEIIPTPREISKECGFTILVHNAGIGEVRDFFNENELKFSHIYKVIEDGEKKRYEEDN